MVVDFRRLPEIFPGPGAADDPPPASGVGRRQVFESNVERRHRTAGPEKRLGDFLEVSLVRGVVVGDLLHIVVPDSHHDFKHELNNKGLILANRIIMFNDL